MDINFKFDIMKVSVLMATYNRACVIVNGISLLERSINSFLNQDYENSNLIILNDGSTDNTIEILNKYEGHKRITIYNFTDNKMPPNNWNWLWDKADGEFICQLHDDDELTKDSITLRVNEFIKNPSLQVVYGGVITQNIDVTDTHVILAQKPDAERIVVDEYINFTALMYRRELPFRFDPDLRYYFDGLFKIRCLKECNVGYIPDPVMRYTVHHGQETNKCRREKMNASEDKLMRKKLLEIYK